MSSGNVSKYEFLTGKDVLPEKNFLEKAATKKGFEYSLLGKELEKQISVAEKQYQSFDRIFNHDGKEEPLKIDESSLLYGSKYSFSEYANIGKYFSLFNFS